MRAALLVAFGLVTAGCGDEQAESPRPADDRPIDPKAAEALDALARTPHPPPAAEARQFCKSLRAINRAAAGCSRCVDALVKALPHITPEMNQGACWLKDLGRVEPPRADLCRALAAVMARDQEDIADYAFRALALQQAGCRDQLGDAVGWIVPRMRRFDGDHGDLIPADLEALEALLPILAPAQVTTVRAAARELAGRVDAALAAGVQGPARDVTERRGERARALAEAP